MLYDPEQSELIVRSIHTLPPTTKRVLWTPKEEEILTQEASKADFPGFQTLLEDFRNKFHPSRTARSLEAHYYKMKRGKQSAEASNPIPPSPIQVTPHPNLSSTPTTSDTPQGHLILAPPPSMGVSAQPLLIGKILLHFLFLVRCLMTFSS